MTAVKGMRLWIVWNTELRRMNSKIISKDRCVSSAHSIQFISDCCPRSYNIAVTLYSSMGKQTHTYVCGMILTSPQSRWYAAGMLEWPTDSSHWQSRAAYFVSLRSASNLSSFRNDYRWVYSHIFVSISLASSSHPSEEYRILLLHFVGKTFAFICNCTIRRMKIMLSS